MQNGNFIVLSIFWVCLTMIVSPGGIVSLTMQPSQLYSFVQLEKVEKYIVRIAIVEKEISRAIFI